MSLPSLVELAENANTYTPLGPTEERDRQRPLRPLDGTRRRARWNVAQRFRLAADELDEVREEIHAHLRAKGRTACTWEIGTHATPDDLVDRLLALGLVDDEPTPLAVGMVLTEPPAHRRPASRSAARPPAPNTSRLQRIAAIAFGGPVPTEMPPEPEPDPDNVVYLAYVDGEPVARGSASFSEHAWRSSAVDAARGSRARRLSRARRRPLGGRRRARHADARHPGVPMSRPILGQLGFRELCEIRILLDQFGAGA